MKQYKKSLFIFRRDLRLADNTGLNEAQANSNEVIPCFICDPKQVEPHPYQSKRGLFFLIGALRDIAAELRKTGGTLSLFYDSPQTVLGKLLSQHKIDAVYVNLDYTPFSRQRDAALKSTCENYGVSFHSFLDLLLTKPEEAMKKDGSPYTVFTPFFNNASKLAVKPPNYSLPANLSGENIGMPHNEIFDKVIPPGIDSSSIPGGRETALEILSNLERFEQYEKKRDIPALDATTHLSVHFKFGDCSCREAFYGILQKLGENHPLIRQLYWRDFFTHIGYHFPHVFGHAFKQKYDALHWENSETKFQAWCRGETGYPIVDAGMRELNETGYMHNRVRMITASFLVKDLRIDWRWGEKYFAQQLIDYDPCVNNGNWQWAASTGCDAQPYFRIFNPWNQQKKFDGDCRYTKKWVPELKPYSPAQIHGLAQGKGLESYPAPIVDHKNEVAFTKEMYKAVVNLSTT